MDYIKRAIKQFSNSVPAQAKANADAKIRYENDNNAMLDAFIGFDRFEEDFYADLNTAFIKPESNVYTAKDRKQSK